MVLHLFGRDLKTNMHVHMLMTEGGLTADGKWVGMPYIEYKIIRNKWQYAILTAMRKAMLDSDAINKGRADSLTAMRKAMIQDEEAVCMVVMGGKTKRPDIPPGVDEEIELAKAAHLPVFLVGSAGGRTAELASVLDMNDWKERPNYMSPAFNHELMVSMDYSVLANEILDNLGL